MKSISKTSARLEWTKENVIEELVKEFGEEYREEITDSLNLDSEVVFGVAYRKAGSFEIDGEEYIVVKDDEEGVRLAEVLVRDLLREDLYAFSKDFIERHLYVPQSILNDIISEEEDAIREDLLYEFGVDDESELSKKKRKEFEEELNSRLKSFEDMIQSDPVRYLFDLGYTMKQLLEKGLVDIDYGSAIEEAIEIDGWEHFVASGNEIHSTENGFIYALRY